MATKFTTGGQRVVPSKGKRAFVGTPKGYEPRPAFIDYKNAGMLRKFLTGQGKLMSRKRTGLSSAMQKELASAVKRARIMALLPYVAE